MRRILVPLRAGVLSALGLVLAPAAFDVARTRKVPLGALDFAALSKEVAEIRAEIAARLREVDASAPRFEVALGLGYVGQSYQVPVGVHEDRIAALTPAALLADFATAYRAKYGYFYDDVPVELVTVHVTGTAGAEVAGLVELPQAKAGTAAAASGKREAWSARARRFVPFTVYDRTALQPGMAFDGPCLVEEDSATTVVDADSRVTVDRFGSLDIALGATE
jgi:N-methylhydantoinase A